jgi:hypothetical protein
MNVNGVAPILNVSSLEDSFAWFAKLAWEKRWDYGDPPAFGAVGNGMFESFLCLGCEGCRANDDDNDGGAWMSYGARRDEMRQIFDTEGDWGRLLEAFARAAAA